MEKAHGGEAVLCLAEGGPDCTFLLSGGKDSFVNIWNQSLQLISRFEIFSPKISATPSAPPSSGGPVLAPVDGSVGSLDVMPLNSPTNRSLTILVGTVGGDIIEVTTHAPPASSAPPSDSGEDQRNKDLSGAEATCILHSHFKGELWGLATHPSDPNIYATGGDDGSVQMIIPLKIQNA